MLSTQILRRLLYTVLKRYVHKNGAITFLFAVQIVRFSSTCRSAILMSPIHKEAKKVANRFCSFNH